MPKLVQGRRPTLRRSGKSVVGTAEVAVSPSLRLYPIWRPEPPESGTPSFSYGEEAEEEKADNTIQD